MQLELPPEKPGRRKVIECDCRTTSPHRVVLLPSLDPDWLVGSCLGCKKRHAERTTCDTL